MKLRLALLPAALPVLARDPGAELADARSITHVIRGRCPHERAFLRQ